MQPVRLRLPDRGARIGIVGCAKYSNEDVCLADLARELINDRYGGAGIVDEQFLASAVDRKRPAGSPVQVSQSVQLI